MKVSIITSAFNCKKYLKEMVDSIIAQTYRDWEMILIDDASDDGTWNVIKSIVDDRIIKIRNIENVGLTKNLNRALGIAQGKYIMRMDADDIAAPDRIEKQVAFMEVNPDVVLSGCWMQCFGEVHDITKTHLNDMDIRIDLIFNTAIMHPTFIVRNDVIKKYAVKYNEDLKYAQDYFFAYQLSEFGKLANIPEVLVRYRAHAGQIGSKYRSEQKNCADVTRNKILRDMGIELNDDEFKVWSNFCLGEVKQYDQKERELLLGIAERLADNKHLKNEYDSQKLKERLSEKLYLQSANDGKTGSKQEQEAEKYKRLFGLMNRWLKLKQRGKSLADWFSKKGLVNIAIYGMGEVGECLVDELKDSPVHVVYGIDRYSGIRCSLKEVVSLNDTLKEVDAIVITTVHHTDDIKMDLSGKVASLLILLEDIIFEIDL
ncbi:glycosyltransferase [Acetatifactor muris]|uniref:Glycosyltransferase EpsE n=1 Tax=Acetatifactor muris TaxID=879566 RepID=A0A2K4ZG62_9FIRM|nr:glycosyltransferase family 2 protein [Acetatifactor muris]MCR2045722.1 glycosyltransferase [Acetatifactor muris]SOY29460.1 Putative glycosyltransferase EpsE [Acetatifactor muris]